jgi:ribA/ribD-fused uncharacterized protein
MNWHQLLQIMKDNSAPIDRFVGELEIFSNFFPEPVMLDGVKYDSNEYAFQAAKTDNPEERERVRLCSTPGKAKRMGRKVALRPDWESVKLQVMEILLIQKFSNPELRQKLVDTWPLKIVEGNNWHDNFWGDCDCGKCTNIKGQNHLGRLLMKLREELRQCQ